jgi:hypothetical protein
MTYGKVVLRRTLVALHWLALPLLVTAQYNAVYNSSGSPTPSAAFIDASVSTFSSSDFCTQVYNALSYAQTLTVPPAGVVIDARGLAAFPNTCGTSSTPWSQTSKPAITIPSTILLPNGTIDIGTTWIIPPQTRIIGKGKTQTTIAAGSGFTGSAFLQMCSSTCTGVSISDLFISGAGANVTGIINQYAQELSFVQNVTINEVEGIGIDIESGATNSGPYAGLNITAGGTSFCDPPSCTIVQPTTLCILINGASTRGIHGLTCTANGTPNAGISLNGNNNSIEDVHVEGVIDGIRIGEKAAAAANYLANINGGSGGSLGTSGVQHNVVHICGSNPASTYVCTASFAVTDLTLLQIKTTDTGHTALLDDISGVELDGTNSNTSVASYIRGEALSTTSGTYGYTQLTTATATGTGPTLPTPTPQWVQASLGTSTTPSNPCATGAIFSNITGTTVSTGHVLWACVNGSWTSVK